MTAALHGATRAYLPETPEVYVLGPLDAPLLMLNVTDDYGCAWLVDEPEGWDAPEFVTPMDARQDGHGGFAGITTFPPRPLQFEGMVSCPDPSAARAARTRLLEALSSNLHGQILYTQLDDEPAKSLWTKPAGKVRARIVDGYAVVFAFTLIAENPLKFGTSATYGTARLPTAAGQPGRVYPRVYPVTYGAGGIARQDLIAVPNAGNEWADAFYQLTGPVPQPRVELTTGEFFGLTADLGPLDVLEVDTRAGTVRVNGVNRADVLQAGSTYPQIPKGGTEIRLRSQAGGEDPAAGLTVTTAPTWK